MSDAEMADLDMGVDDDPGEQDPESKDLDGEPSASEVEPQRKGKGKAKAKSKAKGLVNDMGKVRGRVKDGKKFCPACGKWLPISDFPAGSGQCGDNRKVIQNLGYAAKAQGQDEWWEETRRDPAKLKKVVAAYKARQPVAGKKRKETFVILEYIEERRKETAV